MVATRPWAARIEAEFAAVRSAGRWRVTRELASNGPVTGRIEGGEVVTFASNDYLGLTHHPAVVAAAHEALDRWGTGAGVSRLIVGTRPLHAELAHTGSHIDLLVAALHDLGLSAAGPTAASRRRGSRTHSERSPRQRDPSAHVLGRVRGPATRRAGGKGRGDGSAA